MSIRFQAEKPMASKYDSIGHQAAKQLIRMPKARRDAQLRRFRAAKPELGEAVARAYHRLLHKRLNTIPDR